MGETPLNVLSLFDGIACGRLALERAGITVDNYYGAEIDKHAISVAKTNWPDLIPVGDVTKLKYYDGLLETEHGRFVVGNIDLVIGGSPCQSISTLGDGSGLDGSSGLFYHYLRLLSEVRKSNDKVKFLLENVVGNKKAISTISDLLGVEPVLINSNVASAQNRARYYWTNIEFDMPPQADINLVDILESGVPELSKISEARLRWLESESGVKCLANRYAVIDPIKANCLTARSDASWNSNYVTREGFITRLTPTEYERLQTLPDGYTIHARTSERYRMIGNGWTVDVVVAIFSGLRS